MMTLSMREKLQVLETYLFTKGLFHIGTWSNLSFKLVGKVHAKVMRLYRHALSETWKVKGEDALFHQALIDKFGLVAPINMVALARIQLLGRVALKAPEYFLQLLWSCCRGIAAELARGDSGGHQGSGGSPALSAL